MRAPKMGDDRENGDREGEKRGRLIFNQGLGSTTPFAEFFCREDMGMKLGYRACSIRIRKKGGERSVVTFFLLLFGQVEEEEEEAGLGFPSPSILFPLWSLPRPPPPFEKGKRRRRRKVTKTKMVSARLGPGKKRREGGRGYRRK